MKTTDENRIPPAEPPADPAQADAERLTRLETENGELRSAIRAANARGQITERLRQMGARSPGLLFEAVKGDLQFADDDSPANAEALAKQLAKQFPEQFGTDAPHASIDGGAGRAAAPALTKEALAKMTPAEIAKLDWAAVREVLAS